jgi:uncharacterized membrane protein
LPHPETLERYQKLLPTAVERIFDDFEKTAQHMREIQSTALAGEIADARRRQWMVFCLVLLGLLLSAAFVFAGHETTGNILLGTTIGVIIGGFLLKRRHPEKREGSEPEVHSSCSTSS